MKMVPKSLRKTSREVFVEGGREGLTGMTRRSLRWVCLVLALAQVVETVSISLGSPPAQPINLVMSGLTGLILLVAVWVYFTEKAGPIEEASIILLISKLVAQEVHEVMVGGKMVRTVPMALPSSAAVQSVIDRAAEVLGSKEDAGRWLGTPVRALNFATPISVLSTPEGAQRVSDLRGQIEHGVW